MNPPPHLPCSSSRSPPPGTTEHTRSTSRYPIQSLLPLNGVKPGFLIAHNVLIVTPRRKVGGGGQTGDSWRPQNGTTLSDPVVKSSYIGVGLKRSKLSSSWGALNSFFTPIIPDCRGKSCPYKKDVVLRSLIQIEYTIQHVELLKRLLPVYEWRARRDYVESERANKTFKVNTMTNNNVCKLFVI